MQGKFIFCLKFGKSCSLLLIGAALAASVAAADLPKRKAGLWEIKTQMSGMPAGMPGSMPMQMCIDQNTDNLMKQDPKQNCSTMDVKPGAGGMTIHAVCRTPETTVTMDAVLTGALDSGYKSDMKMSYNPPMHGMKESRMTQEAKWLGPCKPGQKPGDVVMQTAQGGSINLNEMMKNPQMQEMMKQQQRK